MMEYIIDRFEGEIAVLEGKDGKVYNLDKNLLPKCFEGDKVIINIKKTKAEDVTSLFKSLLKD